MRFLSNVVIWACFSVSVFADKDSVEQEIIGTQVAMWAAIEAEDVARYASYVHPDYTAFNETATEIMVGRDKEIASVTGWVSRYDEIKTWMRDARVTVVGDMAVLSYIWEDTSIHTESGTHESSTGKSTRIFKREGDKWLCLHAHFTYIPSPKAQAE